MHMIKEIGKVKSSIFRITDCYSSSTIKLHIRDFHRVRYVHSLMQPSIILWVTRTIFITFIIPCYLVRKKYISRSVPAWRRWDLSEQPWWLLEKRVRNTTVNSFFICEYLTPWFYHNTSNCENNKIANVEFLS